MSIANRKDVYPCDGTQYQFDITFDYDKPADIFAFLSNSVTGESRRLIRNQDYTVEGTVLTTRVDARRDPWPVGWDIAIMRRTDVTQPSSQQMVPNVFRHRVEQLTKIFQEINEQTLRTLFVGSTYPAKNVTTGRYAYEWQPEGFALIARLTGGNLFNHPLPEGFNIGVDALIGGDLFGSGKTYTLWPAEGFDVSMGRMSGGDLFGSGKTYTLWPAEGFDVSMGRMSGGDLFGGGVAYTLWPSEGFDLSAAVLTGGLLS